MTKKTPAIDNPSMTLSDTDTDTDTAGGQAGGLDETGAGGQAGGLDETGAGGEQLDDQPAVVEPKPGDADYDWSGHYGTDDLYVHTYPDGQVVALRRFKDIYSKQWLRSIKNLPTDFDIESAAIDRAACPTAQDLIDNRPCPVDGPDDFAELYKAWVESDTEGLKTGE